MRWAGSALLLLAFSARCAAEFLPADDWLVCWRPALGMRTREVLRGLDAREHRAELRGRLFGHVHARVRVSALHAASLDERGLRVALRWRAPGLELQGEGGLARGDLPGLPPQTGRFVGAAAAMTLSHWWWGVRWTQRRRDVPERSRFQFALRHRAGPSVITLLRENHPFAPGDRWALGAAAWLGPALRMGFAADGESIGLRWRVQRASLALGGAIPLWSEVGTGPSLTLEWSPS